MEFFIVSQRITLRILQKKSSGLLLTGDCHEQ